MELRYWWELNDMKNMNKLIEWKAFVDAAKICDARRQVLMTEFG